MRRTIDYFFATMSPWAYLGHARFERMAAAASAEVRVRPMDLGKIFPLSGGLPLGKRAPQRQAYRLVELKRFSEWLDAPLNPTPKYFPVAGDDAARLIVAADEAEGSDAAMRIAGALMRAVWVDELNIADEATLARLLAKCGLPEALLERAHSQAVAERYERDTQRAIDAGVFGAPSYVIDGEIFWGQDRLDFLDRAL